MTSTHTVLVIEVGGLERVRFSRSLLSSPPLPCFDSPSHSAILRANTLTSRGIRRKIIKNIALSLTLRRSVMLKR